MTLREKIALTLGLIGGYLIAQLIDALRGEPNTCMCRECRRMRWVIGEDQTPEEILRDPNRETISMDQP